MVRKPEYDGLGQGFQNSAHFAIGHHRAGYQVNRQAQGQWQAEHGGDRGQQHGAQALGGRADNHRPDIQLRCERRTWLKVFYQDDVVIDDNTSQRNHAHPVSKVLNGLPSTSKV